MERPYRDISYSKLLKFFLKMVEMNEVTAKIYFLTDFREIIAVAEVMGTHSLTYLLTHLLTHSLTHLRVDNIENLTFSERYSFSLAPVSISEPKIKTAFFEFISTYADRDRSVTIPHLLGRKTTKKPRSPVEILELEILHKILELYLWLAQRHLTRLSPTHSPTHSLTHSLTHLPTHSLTYSFTYILTHSLYCQVS
jgi:hypothetical protein